MNEFPKRSKASISKQTNQHILKYEKYKIVEAVLYRLQSQKYVQNFKLRTRIRLMRNFSIHDISPIIVNLVEDSDSDLENSDDDEDE
jgi:hypothetical protein